MVKAPSEAVRPSLNVTIQEKANKNSLSHHGETAMDVEGQNEEDSLDKREEQSSSSTDKKITRSKTESEQGEESEDEDIVLGNNTVQPGPFRNIDSIVCLGTEPDNAMVSNQSSAELK